MKFEQLKNSLQLNEQEQPSIYLGQHRTIAKRSKI